MKFKTMLTTKLLESNLSAEEINMLPASYQSLGDICVIKLDKGLERYKKSVGNAILGLLPQFKAVCVQGKISGEYRRPEIELIAGILPKEITIHENGCTFRLNPQAIMYSQGNHQEKKRMIATVKDSEIIVDMFAGIGYFTVPIAKNHKNSTVYAIEKNPESFKYLLENIRANYLSNVIPILSDAGKARVPQADRVIMGLIPSCKAFVKTAARLTKKGAVIHYHGLAREKKEYALLNDFGDFKVRLLKTIIVKGYKPHVNHVVLDIQLI